jgi:hypothetical protein
MRQRATPGHRHRWEEELRIMEKNETLVCFFCPDCHGRKEERWTAEIVKAQLH